jgi:hypothetical protein
LRIHSSSWLVAAETIRAAVQNGPSNIRGAHEGARLTTVYEVGEAQRNGNEKQISVGDFAGFVLHVHWLSQARRVCATSQACVAYATRLGNVPLRGILR